MAKQQDKTLTMAAAQRGYIVQRVLVDGWTVRQAAGAFGVDDKCVARWVRAYRRRGMASLRADDTAPERAWRRMLIALQHCVPQASATVWQLIGRADPAACVELHRDRDDVMRR